MADKTPEGLRSKYNFTFELSEAKSVNQSENRKLRYDLLKMSAVRVQDIVRHH